MMCLDCHLEESAGQPITLWSIRQMELLWIMIGLDVYMILVCRRELYQFLYLIDIINYWDRLKIIFNYYNILNIRVISIVYVLIFHKHLGKHTKTLESVRQPKILCTIRQMELLWKMTCLNVAMIWKYMAMFYYYWDFTKCRYLQKMIKIHIYSWGQAKAISWIKLIEDFKWKRKKHKDPPISWWYKYSY